jgi:hypothetical protein
MMKLSLSFLFKKNCRKVIVLKNVGLFAGAINNEFFGKINIGEQERHLNA